MADTSKEKKESAAEANATAPRLSIRGQYVKDLSFESPSAPQSLLPQKEQPKIEVHVDINAQKIGEKMFESSLKINVKATIDQKPYFLIELDYGGIFAIENVREEQLEPMLFIECPFILFPFARRVVADITRDGGYMPLMLEPIDFHYLYTRRKQAQIDQAQKGDGKEANKKKAG